MNYNGGYKDTSPLRGSASPSKERPNVPLTREIRDLEQAYERSSLRYRESRLEQEKQYMMRCSQLRDSESSPSTYSQHGQQ